eukprot:TRINITY_DN8161_c0_g1_i1.p1 TRINITY_DN8161_c0_g1~~TRINITY_DN8161_c0_g1_i1.p1  ORF type:complete len:120 (-),score=10.74 TRINITY_DN8161_c0_g1_i1:161-520(-)
MEDQVKAALPQLFGSNPQLELAYKASKHGWSNATFHNLCDNYAPTLTAILLQSGSIIGGFTTKQWKNHEWHQVKDSFLFRISTDGRVSVFKAHLITSWRSAAMVPYLGGDLRVDISTSI